MRSADGARGGAADLPRDGARVRGAGRRRTGRADRGRPPTAVRGLARTRRRRRRGDRGGARAARRRALGGPHVRPAASARSSRSSSRRCGCWSAAPGTTRSRSSRAAAGIGWRPGRGRRPRRRSSPRDRYPEAAGFVHVEDPDEVAKEAADRRADVRRRDDPQLPPGQGLPPRAAGDPRSPTSRCSGPAARTQRLLMELAEEGVEVTDDDRDADPRSRRARPGGRGTRGDRAVDRRRDRRRRATAATAASSRAARARSTTAPAPAPRRGSRVGSSS